MDKVNIFWFRRDLRLNDNHGLRNALKKGNVLPIFIFDSNILDKVGNKNDKRIQFIYNEIINLNIQLKKYGSSILVLKGKPIEAFKWIISKYKVHSVFYNNDYEPYAIQRDQEINNYLKTLKILTFSFKDQVIFEKSEIIKKDLTPYTIFTPYSKKWKEKLKETVITIYDIKELVTNFYKSKPFEIPSLEHIGFNKVNINTPSKAIDQLLISNYHKARDIPSIHGTSRLSIHLRFGTISIRELVKTAQELNQVYLNELIWREFYMMILWHFPKVVNQSFKKKFDLINWRNNKQEFYAWCNGETGYLLVDAGMRELNKTGYMHNRLRMITASFLTKHLLIDWRWGEAYFAEKLSDYELSSNNGGWQWAASTGCDAVPYFRIFNPLLQTKKFDREHVYIKKWIPELNTSKYPSPIVNHKLARERALNTYKKIYQ